MKSSRHLKSASQFAVLGLAILAAGRTYATDGYFDFGYGTKAKGVGGAGVAFAQDSLAPASNPAGLAFLANRFDAGLTYFKPDRSASFGSSEFSGNGIENFFIPELGFKHSLTTDWDYGIAVYGNGGMNTDYKQHIFGPGISHTGVSLEQVFVAPTLTYKITENHAIGIDPIFALQRFKAYGLENFGVGNNGYDYSYGGGVRIGYTGKLTDWLTVGATYQSRIFASRFHDYANLFAEQGGFDIPSNLAVGFALNPYKPVTLAVDVERIFFSEVKAVGNNLSGGTLANGLGADGGPGFG